MATLKAAHPSVGCAHFFMPPVLDKGMSVMVGEARIWLFHRCQQHEALLCRLQIMRAMAGDNRQNVHIST